MDVEQIGFKTLSPPIVACKIENSVREGKIFSNPQKGVIVAVESFPGKPDKNTFVQFRPDSSSEAKTFRLAAFANMGIIELMIEDQLPICPQHCRKLEFATLPPTSIADARNIPKIPRISPTGKSKAIQKVQATKAEERLLLEKRLVLEERLMQVMAQIHA